MIPLEIYHHGACLRAYWIIAVWAHVGEATSYRLFIALSQTKPKYDVCYEATCEPSWFFIKVATDHWNENWELEILLKLVGILKRITGFFSVKANIVRRQEIRWCVWIPNPHLASVVKWNGVVVD